MSWVCCRTPSYRLRQVSADTFLSRDDLFVSLVEKRFECIILIHPFRDFFTITESESPEIRPRLASLETELNQQPLGQRRYLCNPRFGHRQSLSQGFHLGDFKPCQLDRPSLRRSPQESWRLRPQAVSYCRDPPYRSSSASHPRVQMTPMLIHAPTHPTLACSG